MEEKFDNFTIDIFDIGTKVFLTRIQPEVLKKNDTGLSRRDKKMMAIIKSKISTLKDCHVWVEGDKIYIRIVPDTTIQDFINLFQISNIDPKKLQMCQKKYNVYHINHPGNKEYNNFLLFYFDTNQILSTHKHN
jgi:hypothetical protein